MFHHSIITRKSKWPTSYRENALRQSHFRQFLSKHGNPNHRNQPHQSSAVHRPASLRPVRPARRPAVHTRDQVPDFPPTQSPSSPSSTRPAATAYDAANAYQYQCKKRTATSVPAVYGRLVGLRRGAVRATTTAALLCVIYYTVRARAVSLYK